MFLAKIKGFELERIRDDIVYEMTFFFLRISLRD